MNVPKKALSLILSFALVAGTAISSGAYAEIAGGQLPEAAAEGTAEPAGTSTPEETVDTPVTDIDALRTALADTSRETITLGGDIEGITSPVVVSSPVTIDGNGHTLSFTGLENVDENDGVDDGLILEADGIMIKNLTVDAGLEHPETWSGIYAIHAYKSTATLENVTATGGNGGILVNASTVTLSGTIDVSGNGFGGIEVSKGDSVQDDSTPSLTVENGATLVNTTEAYATNPTIWEDGVTDTVTASDLTCISVQKDENKTQPQYYLNKENSGVAEIDSTIYQTLADAISAAQNGQTVKLLHDINTGDQKFVFSKENVTFDLNGCTATTTADPFITIADDASLTITDSNSSSAGMLHERRDYSYLLLNKGTLTIEKGVFKATSEDYYGNSSQYYGAFALAMSSNSTTMIDGGEFTGAIYTNGTSTGVNTTYNGGTFNSMLYLAAKDLTVSIKGGTFKGGVEVKGSTVNITGGTFHAADVTPDHTPNGNGSSTNGGWAFVVVDNPNYGTVNATISGGTFNGMVEMLDDDSNSSNNKDTLSVTGGQFTNDPFAYVGKGKTTEKSDNYFTIVENTGHPDVAVAADKPKAQAADQSNGALVSAAAAIANAPAPSGLETAVKGIAASAPDANTGKQALNTAGISVTDNDAVTIYVQPYLDITVTDAKVSEANVTELTLDIKPMVKTVATTAANAGAITSNNSTVIGSAKELENVTTPVTLTIPLPSTFQVPEGGLQVKHVKTNGRVYYYPATISGTESKTATFTVTHGFSDFTLQAADTRTLTVDYDSGVAETTYSITDVGSALPTASKPGYDFNGWKFGSDTEAYTTLTDALWDAATKDTAAGATVSVAAAAQFTKQSSGNPGGTPVVPEQPEEPTATYKSDTTYDLTVNGAYTFLITSLNGKKPSFAVGTPGVFRTELVRQDGNKYYYKITSVGKAGSQAGIYINGGSRLLVATVGKPAATYKSDTTYDLSVNGAYTFQITSLNGKKPSFAVGTPGVFRTELVNTVGSNYYYKITSVGKKGAQAGIYLNGESRLLIATVK